MQQYPRRTLDSSFSQAADAQDSFLGLQKAIHFCFRELKVDLTKSPNSG